MSLTQSEKECGRNGDAAGKKRFAKAGIFLARLLAVALWAGMAFGALELWMRIESRRDMRDNPYVQSKNEGKPWPFHDLDATPYGSDAAPPQTEPEVSPEELWRGRAAWVAGLSDAQRDEFVLAFQSGIFEADAHHRLLRSYPDIDLCRKYMTFPFEIGASILDALPESASPLRAAIENGAGPAGVVVATAPLDPDRIREAVYCQGGSAFLFIRITARNPEKPWWDIPGFIYLPHTQREESPLFLNNRGFRGGDLAVPKPPDRVRIVCIGGSTTEEGPINDFTYPALLGRILRERYGLRNVETVNSGVSGATTFHHLSRFPDYLALEPDMLIFYEGTNDLVRRLFPKWIEHAGLLERSARHSIALRRFLPASLLPPEHVIREAFRATTIANLEFMAEKAAARGIGVAVCSFAHPTPALLTPAERAYFEATRFDFDDMETGATVSSDAMSFEAYLRAIEVLNDELRAFCARSGVCYIPVAEACQGGAILFGDICHMKNYGIMRKAECVARSLAPLLESHP